MKKFIAEFRAFAIKGNVMDLAVAVIIGAAFGKIVSSFVNDLIMPLISAIFAIPNFSEFTMILNGSEIMIGLFIQSIVDFLIIALVVFSVVRSLNKLKKEKEKAPIPKPVSSKEELLLAEIRDILKKK